MSPTATAPRFSIVTACYRVGQYLDRFFASLEEQDVGDGELEIVAVDDGSDDDTWASLQRWKERSRFSVTLLQKTNGGQASARNLGLEHAAGEWLTFTDPDDWLDRHYLRNIGAFIDANPEVMQVSAQLVPMHEQADGTFQRRGHPLDAMFGRDRLYDLNVEPDHFSGSAPASFVRADLVREFGLTFDAEITPNFEDAHFVARYLLSCPKPLLGLVGTAKYHYRKRGDGSSTLQTSLLNPARYTVVPERGYLDLLTFGRRVGEGVAPEWVQNLVLYDLSWFFDAEEKSSGVATAAVGRTADVFIGHLAKLANELSPFVIRSFDVRRFDPAWRQILLHSFSTQEWSTEYVVMQTYNKVRDEVRITCRFVGTAPEFEVQSGGVRLELVGAKVQSLRYFDHDLLFEWGCWVPASRDLMVLKNGEPVEIRTAWRGPVSYRVTPAELRAATGGGVHNGSGTGSTPHKPGLFAKVTTVVGSQRQMARVFNKYRTLAFNVPVKVRQWSERRIPRWATQRDGSGDESSSEFENAWVLLDRIHNANDSAEVLFRYLRANKPEVNAWFTVEAGTADFERLTADGFGDRVVAYGSLRWRLLMSQAAVIASSHADVPTFDPPELLGLELPEWRRVFLQHGVIKDDLSAWLNPKQLDLIVVSTKDELESIVGPTSAYQYSERETKLTGLPRFDLLQAARLERETAGRPKDLLVVAPTWRHWLLQSLKPGSQRRELADDFRESEFVHQWSQFVSSPEVAHACRQSGLQMVLLPHPNLQEALSMLEDLAGVETLSYDRHDLHEIFARTAVLVTDYSSVAFNIAYLESPTVYFQFDADKIFGGGHVGRKGYFDYETMGFGPVARDLDTAIEATARVVESVQQDGLVPEPWRKRIYETFPFRDGRCSERAAEEIGRLVGAERNRR